MKGRESGMPDENYWQSFFDADCVIEQLGCASAVGETVVEFGSGYGTFTLPLARRSAGSVAAFDIEPELVAQVAARADAEGLMNVRVEQRDFVAAGSGLPDHCAAHAMLFNILHIENPVALLREAWRVLQPGGVVSVIHWNYDPATPRGPSMEIRPRPADCRGWAEEAGLVFVRDVDLSACCQHHYGMIFMRPHA
jgi:SAM-dependent methyltransferase